MSAQIDPSELVPGLRLPSRTLRFRFTRSSGPGGQNVNKLNTKATLYVEVSALCDCLDTTTMTRLRQIARRQLTDEHLILASDEHRSQQANRRVCLEKLRHLIRRARYRPRLRKPTRPSSASIERRLRVKQQRSKIKSLRRRPGPE